MLTPPNGGDAVEGCANPHLWARPLRPRGRVAGPPPDGFPTPNRIKILDARRKLWPSSERLVLF